MKGRLVGLIMLAATSAYGQFPYPDTATAPLPEKIIEMKSHRLAQFTWSAIRAANPSFALINEGGVYQIGYSSQWAYMVGKTGNVKVFGEYTWVPERFIPHLFHAGIQTDIVTFVEPGLIFTNRYGFTPGIGLFTDFRDYGLSVEYAAWYDLIQYTRFFARYRFNFWISQSSIGYQDFAFGLGLPL